MAGKAPGGMYRPAQHDRYCRKKSEGEVDDKPNDAIKGRNFRKGKDRARGEEKKKGVRVMVRDEGEILDGAKYSGGSLA